MNGLLDFFTQGAFWWGTVLGALISGGLTYWTTHRSDTRTFEHDDERDRRKADREQRERNEQLVFEAATTFAGVCGEILANSIDEKKLFNFLRDAYHNEAGTPDPKAMEKFMFAEDQLGEFKRLVEPFNTLKMVAPVALLEHATRLNSSLATITSSMTQPLAKPLAVKTAGEELDAFINVFRKEYGRDSYTASQAQDDAMNFMKTLEEQMHTYISEAKSDMRAAGFTSTPWDDRPTRSS